VVVGALLVWLAPAPRRQTGIEALRGARLFEVEPPDVSEIDFRLRDDHVRLVRRDGAWQVDGRPANAGETAAIDDLLALLTRLRAVDAFRSDDHSQFVFDPPQATITLTASNHDTALELGGFNSTGTTVYGRRAGDPRVFQIGTQILSSMQAVLYQRKLALTPPVPDTPPRSARASPVAPPGWRRGRS
jgi:hypothetical protein